MTRFPNDPNGVHRRAYRFALAVMRAMDELSWQRVSARVTSFQLAKAATSIGANLHEANAAQTRPDFISKCSNALKEAHESAYWLRICHDMELIPREDATALHDEVDELIAIITAIIDRTTRSSHQ